MGRGQLLQARSAQARLAAEAPLASVLEPRQAERMAVAPPVCLQ